MAWVCQTCSANNDDSQERCLVCDSERPAPILKYDIGAQMTRASEMFSEVLASRAEKRSSAEPPSHPSVSSAKRETERLKTPLPLEEAVERAMDLISTDPTRHFIEIKECAERGSVEALNRLGVCYQDGVGTEKDMDKAMQCYEAAVEKGDPYALYNAGVCYLYGIGAEKDLLKAFDYVTKAALKGHPAAYRVWGDYYYYGYMFKASVKESIYFYTRAATLGDMESQYMLGVIYETGPILKRSKKKAIEWYRKAAEQGHEDAREALRRLI